MKLDLNELLHEIHAWKILLKKKDEEIENLQKQLLFSQKQNEILEQSHASLLHEVSELHNAVSSLQNSFRKIDIFEADKENLLDEKEKLKNSLESLEKLYYEKNKKFSGELQKVKEENAKETEKLVHQMKYEASKQVENFKLELERKDDDIKKLKTEIKNLQSQKDQDLLKIKIQYEDKIGKLKQQCLKQKLPSSHDVQMHDIFRQKYLKLEKKSDEEISELKEQIQHLAESSKFKKDCESLSSVLLATNKPNVNTTDVFVQTENRFTDLSKRFEIKGPQDDDDNDFYVKKKVNKTQPVLPQKRKLFNLNQNYYSK